MKRLAGVGIVLIFSIVLFSAEPVVDRPSPPHLGSSVGANPVLSWRYVPAQAPLTNGGFEQGFAGWTASGRGAVTNRPGLTPIEGTNLARLEYGSLTRELAVPSDATGLTFAGSSTFATSWRVQVRSLDDEILQTNAPAMQGRGNNWSFYRTELARFAGQTVRLRVSADPVDAGVYFYFDDFQFVRPTGEAQFQIYFGQSGTLPLVGTTTDTKWPLTGLLPSRGYRWRVDTVVGGQTNTGPVWTFNTAGAVSFEASLGVEIPALICPGDSAAVRVKFFDDLGFQLANAPSTPPLRLFAGAAGAQAPGVLISEIDTGVNDAVEIMNVSTNTINVGGWRLYLYDSSSFQTPIVRMSLPIAAGRTIAPGGVITFREQQNPLTLTNLSLPAVDWNDRTTALAATAILKDTNSNIIDAVFIDRFPTEWTIGPELPPHGYHLSVAAPLDWISDTITAYETNKTYQRRGSRDSNTRDDWMVAAPTMGAVNGGMQLPFSSGYGNVGARFSNLTNRQGVATGTVMFTNSFSNVVIYAQYPDPFGQAVGQSMPIEIVQPGFCISLIAPTNVAENAGLISAVVRLGAAPANDVEVRLLSSETNALQGPATVIVRAGLAEARVDFVVVDNSLLATSKVVVVTASAAGHAQGSASIRIEDDETTVLTLTGPSIVREGELVDFVLHSSVAPATSIPIRIHGDHPEFLTSTRFLLAGSNSLTFQLGFDNGAIEENREVTIRTEFEDWPVATARYSFIDNEARYISLVVPTTAVEGAGGDGVIYLDGFVNRDTVITLQSTKPDLFSVPTNVVVSVGQQSVTFPISFPQNTNRIGQVSVDVTAMSPGFETAARTVLVADDDPDRIVIETRPSPWENLKPAPIRLRAQTRDGFLVDNVDFSSAVISARDTVSGRVLAVSTTPFQYDSFRGWTTAVAILDGGSNITLRAEAHGFIAELPGIRIWPFKPGDLRLATYSPKHDLIVLAPFATNLWLANPGNGQLTKLPVESVIATALSEDGDRLYASAGGILTRIDLATRAVTGVYPNANPSPVSALGILPGFEEDRLVVYRHDGSTGFGHVQLWENGNTVAELPFNFSTWPTIGAEPFTGKFYLMDGFYAAHFEARATNILHHAGFDFTVDGLMSLMQDRPYGHGLFIEPRGRLFDPFAGGFYARVENFQGATAFDRTTSRFAWAGWPYSPSGTLKVFQPATMREIGAAPVHFPIEGGWFLEPAGPHGWALIMKGELFFLPDPATNSTVQADLQVSAEARRHPQSARIARIYVDVTNRGPATATNAMIGLSIPHDGILLESPNTNSLARSTNANPIYSFDLGALTNGQTRSVELDVTIPFPRQILQTTDLRADVFAGSDASETNYANNRATVSYAINFQDPVEPLRLTITTETNKVRVSYTGEPGWSYQLEASTSSDITNGWDVITQSQRPAVPSGEFIVNQSTFNTFYRVKRSP